MNSPLDTKTLWIYIVGFYKKTWLKLTFCGKKCLETAIFNNLVDLQGAWRDQNVWIWKKCLDLAKMILIAMIIMIIMITMIILIIMIIMIIVIISI